MEGLLQKKNKKMKKTKEIDKSYIGICGICCSICPAYRSDECKGCLTLNNCKILKCAKDKKVEYCFFCNKFPCKLFEEGFDWNLNEFTYLDEFSPGIVKWKPYSKEYINLFKMAKKKSKNKKK